MSFTTSIWNRPAAAAIICLIGALGAVMFSSEDGGLFINSHLSVSMMMNPITVSFLHLQDFAASSSSSSFFFVSQENNNNNNKHNTPSTTPTTSSPVQQRRLLLEKEGEEEKEMVDCADCSIRIFGPALKGEDNNPVVRNDHVVSFTWYTPTQQRRFLQDHGNECYWPSSTEEEDEEEEVEGRKRNNNNSNNNNKDNLLVQRFDELVDAPFLQAEIWKFCLFYTQKGNVYWDRSQVVNLKLWQEMWQGNKSAEKEEGGGGGGGGNAHNTALLVVMSPPASSMTPSSPSSSSKATEGETTKTTTDLSTSTSWIHSSFMRLDGKDEDSKSLSLNMLRLLVETEILLLTSNPLYTYQAMVQHIVQNENENNNNDENENDNTSSSSSSSSSWHIWKAKCQVPSPHNPSNEVLVQRRNLHSAVATSGGAYGNKKKQQQQRQRQQTKKKRRSYRYARSLEPEVPVEFSRLPTFAWHCTIPGGYCCQVWGDRNDGGKEDDDGDELPILLVKHPFGTTGGLTAPSTTTTATTKPKPSSLDNQNNRVDDHSSSIKEQQQQQPQHKYPANPVPYWSSITEVPNKDSVPVTKLETPNFFDILLQNNCLPTSPECRSCLKRYTSTTGCDDQCKQECPCYCKVLCQIRPPPKHVQAVWYVSPPLYQLPTPLGPPRLIPRLVHQTWYEPLEPDKYPNMSRLQQSWKQSGWSHTFYDDASAAKFLQEHFPPPVLEAYHAIQPGAFKADLFRYCCLLIKGGVYADMDVLLETNLEEAIAPDVGFMTPMDEPGIKVGQQACLWNGLMAVAPGHPFVAKTIELVVNNIRNRFTSVDYDDMLCPDPVLSASHLWDILFTTGPCILGTAMNLVLQRHPQTGFVTGELDIWGGSSESSNDGENDKSSKKSKNKPPTLVEPDDPRLAIPGRSIILRQDKNDIGAHRFTLEERNLIVCSTDMPDYDDRPKKPHYAESGKQTSLYGTTQLYSDFSSANEEIRVVVVANPNITVV